MDILIALHFGLTGILLGLFACDVTSRLAFNKRLALVQTELAKTVEKLQNTHNSLVSQMVLLQESVNAHEIKLSGRPIGKFGS